MRLSRRALWRSGAVTGLAALAGCAAPPTHYYRLVPVAGAIRRGAPGLIGVRGVSIPGYLDQNGVARTGGAYEFATYANDLWAEPLASMLQAVMVQDLAQRLPDSNVFATGGAIGQAPDVALEMNVLRFDPGADGQLELSVQIALRPGRGARHWRGGVFAAALAPATPAAADMAAAMSQLWGAAADDVVALLLAAQAG